MVGLACTISSRAPQIFGAKSKKDLFPLGSEGGAAPSHARALESASMQPPAAG